MVVELQRRDLLGLRSITSDTVILGRSYILERILKDLTEMLGSNKLKKAIAKAKIANS